MFAVSIIAQHKDEVVEMVPFYLADKNLAILQCQHHGGWCPATQDTRASATIVLF